MIRAIYLYNVTTLNSDIIHFVMSMNIIVYIELLIDVQSPGFMRSINV